MAARGSSGRKINSAGNGTTPTGRQQQRPGMPDSTKAPRHALPVNSVGAMTLTARQQTHSVTGPSSWENGRETVNVAGGTRLAGSSAADAAPCPPPDGR